jgi:hypothetical protein
LTIKTTVGFKKKIMNYVPKQTKSSKKSQTALILITIISFPFNPQWISRPAPHQSYGSAATQHY